MNDQSNSGTTAITNAVVYCADDGFRCFNPGSVVFADGVIAAVGPSASVEVPEEAEAIDAGGRLAVLPGLIDAHSHSSLLKGYSENAQLMDWLPEYQREHQVLTPDDAYYGYLVSYMEALKGGTTTVMDMYRFGHKGAEAADRLGMRVHLVPYGADHPTKRFFEDPGDQRAAHPRPPRHQRRPGEGVAGAGAHHLLLRGDVQGRGRAGRPLRGEHPHPHQRAARGGGGGGRAVRRPPGPRLR